MKQELIIGRGAPADVIPPSSTPQWDTVSVLHARVGAAETEGQFKIVDMGSTNGLFIRKNGTWTRVDRAVVTPETPLRLGLYETSLRALCPPAFLESGRLPSLHKSSRRHPYRDPQTGEIIE